MFNANKRVSVQQFLLVQSGTYTEQMVRPFTTNVERGLRDALVDATQGGTQIGISAVEGVAGHILRPQLTTQGEANVVNGYRSRRFRFLLKIMEQDPLNPHSQIKRIFFGYSDHCDTSYGHHLDPNMRIYFNSETTLSSMFRQTPQGGVWDVQPIGSNQIVSPLDMANAPGVTTAFGTGVSFLIRPDDIFQRGHGQHVVEKLRSTGHFNQGPVELLDQRSIVGKGTSYQYSRRSDTSPSRYLHRTLKGYHHAQKEAAMDNFGYDREQIFAEARSNIANDHIHQVTFFQLLKERAGYMEKGYVTLAELQEIFPESRDPNVTIPNLDNGQSIRRLNYAEDSEHWKGSNEITVAAASIGQIVPAIMMENMLRTIAVNVTNGVGPGDYRIQFIEGSIRAIEDGLHLAPYLAEFERRLKVDLLNTITHNNQISFELSVGCDISGDSHITLRLGHEGPAQFIAPTFMDSLNTFVITNDKQRAEKISTDLLYLLDEVIPESNTLGQVYGGDVPSFNQAFLDTGNQAPTAPNTNTSNINSPGYDQYTGLI